jgi:KaiC/GvpD/RAD55 family RecA-like ATPase
MLGLKNPGKQNSGLPDELVEYLKRDSFSLLIKGGSGTGKTKLALAILRAVAKGHNFLYLSTRVSPEQLPVFHPWIRNWLKETPAPKEDETREEGSLPEAFVDARLEEPTPLFERITSQLMDVRSPLIVIDTWNSIEDFSEYDALQMNMRVLQTWRDRVHAKLILIGEDPNDTNVDALVDGILLLKQKEVEARRLRELVISKLYGVNIANPSYLFSLSNGEFKSFRHFNPLDFSMMQGVAPKKPFEPIKMPTKGAIPTGHRDLDRMLNGGIVPGSIVGVELAKDVDPRIALTLFRPLITNFPMSGNPVLLFPFEGLSDDFVGVFLRSSLPARQLRLVKHLSRAMPGNAIKRGEEKSRVGKRSQKSYLETAYEIKKKFRESKLLCIIGSNYFAGGDQAEKAKELDDLVMFARSNSVLSFLVTRDSDSELRERISAFVEPRLKIVSLNGTLVVQPELPFSQPYAVISEIEVGVPSIRLEPMV